MNVRLFTWLAALACSAIGCVSQSDHQKTLDELNAANNRLSEWGTLNEQNTRTIEQLGQEKNKLAMENNQLKGSNAEANRKLQELQSKMDELSQNSIEGVTTTAKDGMFIYRIEGGILFDSGKADVKASGKKTLQQVADQLKQHDYKIEVAGHTDTDPVEVTKKKYGVGGNTELGFDRALHVWKELTGDGVPEARMRVTSFGEYDPVDPKDKAKNRRVEIRVLVSESTKSNG